MALIPVASGTIASNAATFYTESFETGLLMGLRIEVLTSAGAASVATCDVTISEAGALQRTLLTVTGITGISNWYNPKNELETTAAVSTGLYEPFLLQSTQIKVVVANGTDTNIVRVKALVIPA